MKCTLCYYAIMNPIPLNILTLYADLEQNVSADVLERATISHRLVGGQRRLYADIRRGDQRLQIYLGTVGDPEAESKADLYRRGAADAKIRRNTVAMLKRAGIGGPDLETGRIIEALARGGLFERGALLVGTVAFQTFPPIVGAYLPGAARMTQDADLAATRLAIPHLAKGMHVDAMLKNADAAFAPRFAAGDKLPARFQSSKTGLIVEMLTTRGRSDGPVQIPALGCAAIPLRFMEYLLEDPIEAVVLYGAGVRIKVPDPARYAVHKLIVHQVRTNPIKAQKDLWQAKELIEIYRTRDPDHLDDMIEDATRRGRTWAKLVRDGLRLAEAMPSAARRSNRSAR